MTNIPRKLAVGMPEAIPELTQGLTIYVDDTPVNKVIEYNMDEGYVIRLKTDKKGQVVLNATRTEAEKETLHGEVTVFQKSSGQP